MFSGEECEEQEEELEEEEGDGGVEGEALFLANKVCFSLAMSVSSFLRRILFSSLFTFDDLSSA